MGQNFSGHARLRVRGAAAGTAITMRYGEKIDAAGMLDTSNIDIFMTKTEPRQAFQQDTYICKGGEEVWEQRFSYSGFRYVEVTGFPGTPTVEDFSGRFAHTALESAGEFASSNETVNRIQSATRWAYLSNAQSIPTDCPQREKNGWTGDAQLAAEAGLMNFRSATFYTKWLDDLADVQLDDGRLSPIVPNGGWSNGQCNPAWDSAYAIVARELYRYCGDRRALERHYAGIRRYTDYLAGRLEHGTLTFDSLGDWVPWSTETPSQFTSTIYLYVNAQTVELAATLLGKTGEGRKYAALATTVRDALNAKYFDAARDLYANGSQTALAMPLYFGLVPEGHRAGVLTALIANIERQGHIDTGILGAKYVLRVLAEAGRADLAFRLIMRKEQPSWAWWIEQGATTLWEDWKGASSLNHIMFGDVSNWFFQWVAGIGLDPDNPGFAQFRIQPQPLAGLAWAKASYDSVRGRIISHWERKANLFRLDVTIPANARATVYLPSSDVSGIKESGIPARTARGVHFVREQAGCALFAVGSGRYRFESTVRVHGEAAIRDPRDR
jgi:alpha-L-rhamnosidase